MLLVVSWLAQELFNVLFYYLFGDRLPDTAELKSVGVVSKLCLYPLKSGHRREVESVFCDPMCPRTGAVRDRCFAVTDLSGGFLTGRRYPEMVRIHTEGVPDGFQFSVVSPAGKEVEQCRAPVTVRPVDVVAAGRHCTVRVWDDLIPALDCGDAAAAWFSAAVPHAGGVRLVYFPGQTSTRDPRTAAFPLASTDGAALADLTGYMLMNQASVDDVNSRFPPPPASIDNFRANIVISGAPPYSEDKWQHVAIGGAVFRNVKPCSRCVFTTVDAETGVRRPDGYPLKVLRQYRTNKDLQLSAALGTAPLLGINLGVRRPGTVAVGDIVYAA